MEREILESLSNQKQTHRNRSQQLPAPFKGVMRDVRQNRESWTSNRIIWLKMEGRNRPMTDDKLYTGL